MPPPYRPTTDPVRIEASDPLEFLRQLGAGGAATGGADVSGEVPASSMPSPEDYLQRDVGAPEEAPVPPPTGERIRSFGEAAEPQLSRRATNPLGILQELAFGATPGSSMVSASSTTPGIGTERAALAAQRSKAVRALPPPIKLVSPEEEPQANASREGYKTTEYAAEPERDFASEYRGASKEATRRQNLAEMFRALSHVGTSISGSKREDAQYDRLAKMAGQPVEEVDREMKLDALSRKARLEKIKADPTSALNRDAQDLFISLYPGIAAGREKAIRNMTGDQLESTRKGASEYSDKLSQIQKRWNDALIAEGKLGLERTKAENKFDIDQMQAESSFMNALKESASKGGTILSPGQEATAQRAGANFIRGYRKNKEIQDALPVVHAMEEMDRTIPDVVRGQVHSLQPNWLEQGGLGAFDAVARNVNKALGNDPQALARKASFITQFQQFMNVYRHSLFGASLTGVEKELFDQAVGGQLKDSPEKMALALDIFRRRLFLQLEGFDESELAAADVGGEGLAGVSDALRNSKILISRRPIFEDVAQGRINETAPGFSPQTGSAMQSTVVPAVRAERAKAAANKVSQPPPATKVKVQRLDETGKPVGQPQEMSSEDATTMTTAESMKHSNGKPKFGIVR